MKNNELKQINMHKGLYARFFKRPLDILLSSLSLIGLSPLLIIAAIQVRRKLGAPILFRQDRPGKDGKIFKLYKFRTMTDARDAEGNLLPDKDRLPAFGQKIRSTSIDELPELINIIKGDMSIVGPRPLLTQYLPLYNAHQARRHEVRPGLTGLAQANGRNAISWEEKFDLDVQYVDNITFMMDIKIIFDTAMAVFRHEGISAAGEATMEAFKGTGRSK